MRVGGRGDSELDDMQLTHDGKTMVYTQQTGDRRWRSIARLPPAARRRR